MDEERLGDALRKVAEEHRRDEELAAVGIARGGDAVGRVPAVPKHRRQRWRPLAVRQTH